MEKTDAQLLSDALTQARPEWMSPARLAPNSAKVSGLLQSLEGKLLVQLLRGAA